MNTKNAYKEGKRTELIPEFRKEFFENLFEACPTKLLSNKLDISRGMLYHYKNGRAKTIPMSLLKEFAKLLNIPNAEIKNNTINTILSKDLLAKGLDIGRETRRNKLKYWRAEIPSVVELIENNSLNLGKWFESYCKLIDFGWRKIKSMRKGRGRLLIKYTNYSKGIKKEFISILPLKISLNEDFQYFFGLWCGDKVGGGRIGVANKQIELNLFTEKYLKNIYQKPKFVVLKSSNIKKLPKLQVKIDETVEIKNMPGDYVICVFTVNGILKTFFDYLFDNLDTFLQKLPNRNIFFAGLFDAEGNIYLEDGCFRWACKNRKNVEIFKKHLLQYDLFHRYDGANLVTNNIDAFSKLILPYIRHKKKINNANLVIFGKGNLDARFKNILLTINKHLGKTQSQLANILKKRKLYAQLKFLNRLGYIYHKGYPKRFYITRKGSLEVFGNDHSDQMLSRAVSQ